MSGVTVIIPVRNGERTIGRCLEAVKFQSLAPDEVIVVDGHSEDNTAAIARDAGAKVVTEEYGTIGGARQTGVLLAATEYCAFTDADCIPQSGWLAGLMAGFDDGVAGVGGATKNIGGTLFGRAASLAMDTLLGSGGSVQDRVLPAACDVKSISGCNSIFHRSAIMQAGGFNVRYSVNEDTDLCRRIGSFGRLRYTPGAVVIHDQNRGAGAFARRMFRFGYGRGRHRLFGLPVAFPLALPVAAVVLILWPPVFALLAAAYLALLLLTAAAASIRSRDVAAAALVPIVLALEHLSYSAGFWTGLAGWER